MHLFRDIYLPKSLVARHLAIGLGLALPRAVLENFVGVGLYVVWVTWKASNTGKHILIFVQEIFFSIEKGAVCHVHHTVIPST